MTGRVWVTGASGFTGRHLLAFLRSLPEAPEIVAFDRHPAPSPGCDRYVAADLTDAGVLADAARAHPPDWVIHLAGLLPPASGPEMWQVNVGSLVALLVALRDAGRRGVRVVSVGSAAEYAADAPAPWTETSRCGGASAYGDSKLAQTLVALRLGAETGQAPLVARSFNLIGPGLPERFVLGSLCRQFAAARHGEPISAGNLETARDYVDVRDAVRAYWLVATGGRPGEIYNVCAGRPVTGRQLVATLEELTGRSATVRTDPQRARAGDVPVVVGSSSKVRDAVGWTPAISLERSIEDMLRDAGASLMQEQRS